jgi:hypothetical protein
MTHMKYKSTAALAAAWLIAAIPSNAAPFVYEGFDYDVADTGGKTLSNIDGAGTDAAGGIGFLSAWNNLRLDLIRSTGLTNSLLPASPATGSNSIAVNTSSTGRVFDGSAQDDVDGKQTYFSFLLELPTGFVTVQNRLMLFSSGPNMASGNGFGMELTASGIVARLAATNGGTPTALALNTTHMIVGRYTYQSAAADTLEIWVNPADPLNLGTASSSVSLATSAVTFSPTTSGVYPRAGNNTTAVMYLDELRIGNAIGDVMNVGPTFTSTTTDIVNEGTSGAFHTFVASDPVGGTTAFSLTGPDAGSFTLSGANSENIAFTTPPAFSPAGDANGDNVYEVTVTATNTGGTGNAATQNFAVTVVQSSPPVVTAGNISVSGATGDGGTFRINDTVTVTWDNTITGDNSSGISSVTVDFTQFGGGAAVPATESAGIWTATYVIVAGSIDAADSNVSVTATNPTSSVTTADDADFPVDNIPPVITAPNVTIITTGTGLAGAFTNGDTITAQWNDSATGNNNSDAITAANFNFATFGGAAFNNVSGGNTADFWTANFTVDAASFNGAALLFAVTVFDDAGNSVTLTGNGPVAIAKATIIVSAVTGAVAEGNPLAVATYTVNPSVTPTGQVDVTATPDSNTEVSLDGVSFFPSVVLSFTDTTPKTVTVRANDDSFYTGTRNSIITQAITTTADTLNYPTTLAVADPVVVVTDNEVDPVIAKGGALVNTVAGSANVSPTTATLAANLSTLTGTDRILIVTVGTEITNGANPTGITFDGNPLTLAVENAASVSSAAIWYLVNPPAVTGNIVVSYAFTPAFANPTAVAVSWFVFGGVNQTNPLISNAVAGAADGTTVVTSISADLTGLTADSLVISALTTNGAVTTTFPTTQTPGFYNNALGGSGTHAVSYQTPVSGNTTQSVSWNVAQRATFVTQAFRSASVAGSAYDSWATAEGLTGAPGFESGFTDNPDNDVFDNGLEWILGGNPLANTAASALVTSTGNATSGITLSFTRLDDSKAETTLSVEYSTDMFVTKNSVVVGDESVPDAGNGVSVTVTPGTPTDSIVVNIPSSNAPGGRLFARIVAVKNP